MPHWNFTIRHAKLEDSGELFDLVRAIEDISPYLLDELREMNLGRSAFTARLGRLLASPNSTVVVAEIAIRDTPRLCGYLFAVGGHISGICHCVRVNGMGVLPDFRHQGVGLDILKFLEKWARDAGLVRLDLNVALGNKAAREMYLKAGFETEGVLRGAYRFNGSIQDGWIMSKILANGQ